MIEVEYARHFKVEREEVETLAEAWRYWDDSLDHGKCYVMAVYIDGIKAYEQPDPFSGWQRLRDDLPAWGEEMRLRNKDS